MLGCLLLLQTSLLARPLYLSEEPPPLRSVRGMLLLHAAAEGSGRTTARTLEETLELAQDLVVRLRHGTDFNALAQQYSAAFDAAQGGILGTFAPRMLAPPIDQFLFTAGEGDVSDPITTSGGIRILQRIETFAAVLQMMVDGTGESSKARCMNLMQKLQEGGDFAALASENSEDKPSATRGGQYAIYERGSHDTLLKAQAFQLRVGEIAGPFESPLGFHILKRVAPGDVDPSLAESNFIRLRAILIQFDDIPGVDRLIAPRQSKAKKIAEGLHARLEAGEDFCKLARESTDDTGGREREGDIGWIYRQTPELPRVLSNAFLMRKGQLSDPLLSEVGYVILRRER